MGILHKIAARNSATIVGKMAISLRNAHYDLKTNRHRHFMLMFKSHQWIHIFHKMLHPLQLDQLALISLDSHSRWCNKWLCQLSLLSDFKVRVSNSHLLGLWIQEPQIIWMAMLICYMIFTSMKVPNTFRLSMAVCFLLLLLALLAMVSVMFLCHWGCLQTWFMSINW